MFERIQEENLRDTVVQDVNEILFISIRDAVLHIMSENENSSNL